MWQGALTHKYTWLLNGDFFLLYASEHFKSQVYFRQTKRTGKYGIVFHEINTLPGQLDENICNALPVFHALTSSDNTNTFFGKTKFTCFKRMITHPETCKLLKNLNSPSNDIADVTKFVLQVIYNQPRKEKVLNETRYKLFIKKKGKKKFASTKKVLPLDSALL